MKAGTEEPGRGTPAVLWAAWGRVRQRARGLILFQLWFAALSAVVLTPGLAWLVDALVGPHREAAVTNADLVGYFLSLSGLAWLALTGATAAALLHFAQIGACSVLLGRDHNGWGAMWAGLRCLPLLVRMSLRQFLLMLPVGLLAAGLLFLIKVALLGGHDINFYLHEEPLEWWLALASAGGVVCVFGGVALWLVARWLFAVPLLAGGEARNDREALALSWRRTRGRVRRLLPPLVIGWAAVAVGAGVLFAWVDVLAGALLGWAGMRLVWGVFIVAGALMVFGLLGLLFGALGTSLHAAVSLELLGVSGRENGARPGENGGDKAPAWVRGRWFWLGLGLLWVGVAVGLGFWLGGLDFEDRALVTAHRGSSAKAPENTLAALRQAVADGADYAEIDVQTTHDGRVVLLHDADFMRLAGDPRQLADLDLAEARTIDLGRRFDAKFAGERLATLEEAIAEVRGNLRLNIELKYNRPDPSLVPAVLAILRREAFADACVLTSLDATALAEVRRRNPRLQIGQIVAKAIGDITRLDVDFLSVNAGALTPSLVRAAHRAGKQVHVWTVNTPDAVHRMLDVRVDNLITDHPDMVRDVLRERAGLTAPERLALRLQRLLRD